MASTTLSNGQIIPAEVPMKTQPAQVVQGGILNAAADKTIAANAHQAEVAAKMGAGQKGGKRRKTKRGGATLNAPASLLPTASSIPGVDPTDISIRHINSLNAIRAAAAGDKLANAAPYYPAKTGGKRTKRKANGRRHNRTHRRGNRKHSNGGRRSRRNV